jgi:AAA ATPase containing von Willebrand factor type A (vWA) domain
VFAEIDAVDLLVSAEDGVDLIKVALDDGGAGDLLHLGGRGQVFVAGLAVVAADADVFAAELGAEFVEVEHDGETGAVADEEAALAIEDVAARTGDEDAALVLDAFALVVEVGLDELLVSETAGEGEEEAGEDEVEEDDARIVAAVSFDEAAGALGEIGFDRGNGSGHAGKASAEAAFVGGGEGVEEFERASLERAEPGRDEGEEDLRAEEIDHEARPQLGVGGKLAGLEEGKHEEESEVGDESEDDAAGVFVARDAIAQTEDERVSGCKQQGVGAERNRRGGIEEKSAEEGGGAAAACAGREGGVGGEETAEPEVNAPAGERVVELREKDREQEKRERQGESGAHGRSSGTRGVERDENGDLGERGQARIEGDFARFEEAVGARFGFRDFAEGEAGREDAAEAGGDEPARCGGAGVDVERDEFENAFGGTVGGVDAALKADGAVVVFDEGGDANGGAADEVDDAGVGVDLGDAADDAAAEHDGGADGDAVIGAFAEGHALPPGGEIAAGDAGVFGAEVGVGGEAEEFFEAFDLRAEFGVLLDGEGVLGVKAGEVASGFDEVAFGMSAQRPVFLEIAGVGGGDGDGRGEFEEGGAGEGLDAGGEYQPNGDDEAQGEKRAGLVEAAGRHEVSESVIWRGMGWVARKKLGMR